MMPTHKPLFRFVLSSKRIYIYIFFPHFSHLNKSTEKEHDDKIL